MPHLLSLDSFSDKLADAQTFATRLKYVDHGKLPSDLWKSPTEKDIKTIPSIGYCLLSLSATVSGTTKQPPTVLSYSSEASTAKAKSGCDALSLQTGWTDKNAKHLVVNIEEILHNEQVVAASQAAAGVVEVHGPMV